MKKAKILELTDQGMEDGSEVFLEIRYGTGSVTEPMTLEEFVIKPGKHHLDFMRFTNKSGSCIRRLRVMFYGMKWRCWDSKPTVEQRKAAKWYE